MGFLAEQGALGQFSSSAHAQNGVDERKHRHFLEAARASMIIASLPPHFWVEIVPTSTHLINIHPSSAPQGDISLERLFSRSCDYSTLHLFGCGCYLFFVCLLGYRLFVASSSVNCMALVPHLST